MARPKINPDFIIKVCEGCKKEFTISYRKKRQRFCTKSCAQNTPSVQEKMKSSQLKTYKKKYGVDHPMKTNTTVNKFKNSMLTIYGKDWYKKEHVFKMKQTCLEKYGNENYNNIEKMHNTCLEKYGVKNYVYTDEYKEKSKKTCLEKYGVDHPSKSLNFKHSHYKNMFEKFTLDENFKNFDPMFTENEYVGVTNDVVKYKFKCKRCGNVELHNLNCGFFPICINCDKLNSSTEQKEIYDFLKEILGNDTIILMNEKSILYPKVLDIYIQSFNLAIEYDGLYCHSEISGMKNKVYHINKTKQCISKGLKLIHIFQTDWIYNKDIVKSILKNNLHKISTKIYARNCKIQTIEKDICDIFLNKNHLQGPDNSSIRLGLFYDNELISVMTFGKSRYDKNIEWEMIRYCNKIGYSIRGSASKLFKYFLKEYKPNSIISYSDRRYFDGNLYLILNFKFIHNTSPNYFYIFKNYTLLKSRMNFQKHKLR